MNSIKSKMALMTVVLVLILSTFIFMLTLDTQRRYKALQLSECHNLIDLESEVINKSINRLQENARELALMGEIYYKYGKGGRDLGISIVRGNYAINTEAVGGGIWYEPYAILPARERFCFYAFTNDDGSVQYDKDFESIEYDYHTQDWYTTIYDGVHKDLDVVWTAPYFDDTGTMALMTTIGSGMFDAGGRFIGMSTVDWELDVISQRVSDIRPTPGSFVLFADMDNDFILALSADDANSNTVGSSPEELDWLAGALKNESFVDGEGIKYLSFARELENNMLLVINVPEAELFAEVNNSLRNTLFVLLGACAIIVVVMLSMLQRFINAPVAYLSAKAAEIGAGNLDTRIELHSKDELGRLANTFNSMTVSINDYIKNLSLVTADKERIATELNVATQIQTSMLPCIFPAFPDRTNFDVYATMDAAKEVGGDFYDFFIIDSTHLAVVMADVSGKGVPAALFMVIAKTLIKNHAQTGLSPEEVFNIANSQLCENNDAGMFVTAFMGVLEISTGKFTYVNAGHNLPLIAQEGGTYKWLDCKPGFVLAGLEGMQYKQQEITLNKGDRAFLYTDGVTEAMDTDGKLYSDKRLLDFANSEAWKGNSPEACLEMLRKDIDIFAQGAEQSDDITMLMLEIK